ncbi:MAG TPA: nickel-type superoxide dismutase maturation protease [Acidimicrobiales bacterium]
MRACVGSYTPQGRSQCAEAVAGGETRSAAVKMVTRTGMDRAYPPRLRRIHVEGKSMSPSFEQGDRLLVVSGWFYRPGDVVAVRDPRDRSRILVKRVASSGRDGIFVVGDNPAASTDSRVFGAVPRRLVMGRVVYRYAPAERAGRVKRGARSRRRG